MLTYNVMNDFGRMIDLFFDVPTVHNEFPLVELVKDQDEVKVTAVVPGIKREDLVISLEDNRLIIEGEKKSNYSDHTYLRKERSFGAFKRSIKLPYRVENEKIEAKLENGILSVLLKRSEETKPKKITIE